MASQFNLSTLTLDDTARSLALAKLSSTSVDNSAAVAAAGVASFIQNISPQKKQDVLNSTLLANLGASSQFDRFRETENWYNYYTWIFQNLGWVVKDFKFDKRELSEDTPITVDKIILDYMAEYVDPAQVALMQRTVNGLHDNSGPANQSARAIFLSSSIDQRDKQASFQFGSCVEDANNNVSFSIGAFTYDLHSYVDVTISNTLFTELFTGTASFMSAFQVMTLSDQDYAPHRDSVLQRLATHAQSLIGTVVIPT